MTLTPGCLHLVDARTDAPPIPLPELERLLSVQERERSRRLLLERDRRLSVLSWGLVRTTLGAIVGRDPASLEFARDQFGKPALPGGPSFNLSHSGDRVLIALAEEGRVGVDVEVIRPLPDAEALAERSFSTDEAAALSALAAAERERAFFRIWTRKEAFIKAVGRGMSIPMSSFSVAATAGWGPVALRVDEGEDAGQWSLRAVPCGADAEAAVAWDRPGPAVTLGSSAPPSATQ
jgi:4'-phosphopantetheinyl transferase